MTVTPADLRTIPLFHDISDAHLAELTGAFERKTFPAGHVLFNEGDAADRFLVLVAGEVTLREGSEARFRLRPPAPVGELGALTGIPRSTTAVVATEAEVWSVAVSALLEFFERHGDVAFPFYHNLLGVVSDKVRRDRRRLEEMRANLVRTQKAMKRLRELVLASPENELSQPIFETLDELIEHNRRAHYRVAPVPAYPATARLDDGTVLGVLEISDGFLKLEGPADRVAKANGEAVLVLPTTEILVSGTVQRSGPDGVVLKLDPLIESYRAALEDYVTRLQLLDFVV